MAEKYIDEVTKEWVIREGDQVRFATTYETSLGEDLEAGFAKYGKFASKLLVAGLTVEKGIIDNLTEKYLDDDEKAELDSKIQKVESKKLLSKTAAELTGFEILGDYAKSREITRTGDKQLAALGKHFVKKIIGK